MDHRCFFFRYQYTELNNENHALYSLDLTSKRYIFMPLCSAMHWILIVIDLNNSHIKFLNSILGYTIEYDNNFMRDLIEYFFMKFDQINNTNFNRRAWTYSDISKENYPMQTDGFNCGIYVLKYMEMIANNNFTANINGNLERIYFQNMIMNNIRDEEFQ